MHAAGPVRFACAMLLWSGALCAAAKERQVLILSDARAAALAPVAASTGAPPPLFRAGRTVPASLRDGIGMDYRLGGLGGLQFNLYAPRRARRAGRSWNLNAENPDATAFWLLGGSLGLARDGDDRQEIVFMPQLLLDFNALTPHDRALQAFVQYAPWHVPRGLAGPDELMAQAALRLRF